MGQPHLLHGTKIGCHVVTISGFCQLSLHQICDQEAKHNSAFNGTRPHPKPSYVSATEEQFKQEPAASHLIHLAFPSGGVSMGN